MSEFLGTTWWSVICLVAGFGAGVFLFPAMKSWFAKGK